MRKKFKMHQYKDDIILITKTREKEKNKRNY